MSFPLTMGNFIYDQILHNALKQKYEIGLSIYFSV